MFHFGLAGNPNCGKTTLFNQLTGSNAHVGNWPGVTVDRKEGLYQNNSKEEIYIIDLPGIYSLSPYTPEEIIARNFLIENTPDLILNIIDATNLERNLYLTTQLLEIDCPLVIALNMMDLAEKNGILIDCNCLSHQLGVPVIPISAAKGEGTETLMEKAIEEAKKTRKGTSLSLSFKIEKELKQTIQILEQASLRHSAFLSVKLLESDPISTKNFSYPHLLEKIELIRDKILAKDKYGDMEALIADSRYQYITEYCISCVRKKQGNKTPDFSAQVDKLFTHPVFGIPLFFIFLFFVFHFTFSKNFFGFSQCPSPGVWLQLIMEQSIAFLSIKIEFWLENWGVSAWLLALFTDGILHGVGTVLSFVPQILCLFLFLSILEDSGYMARAAFLMDKILRYFGLSGKAFLPLLMGFGCSVPAIMASRTLESDHDRRIAMMITPYLSCGAKLPIYALFASALFSENPDRVIFGMYFIGIITAGTCAIILNRTVLKSKPSPFILELPAYHFPSIKSLSLLLWDKLKDYVFRAGTLILASTILIWILSNFSFSFHLVEANSSQSILGVLGSLLTPFFRPLGFIHGNDGWKPIVAILSGLVAKEAVVSTLGVLSSPGGEITQQALLVSVASSFSPLSALSFMVFNLLCIPCIAAVSAMHTEMKSLLWTCLTLLFWACTAWCICFLIYQIGTYFGF